MPDVVGVTLDRARRLLADAGVAVVRVTETAPPRTPLVGDPRVVRQRAADGGVDLVVCRERYETRPAEVPAPPGG